MQISNQHDTHGAAHWAASQQQPRIAIIGAGMSGIAAVVKLNQAGYSDITVYEKSSRVGGTWRENTYPGLSCDIPSRWYSFSFALKADWSHRYSYGHDIQAYLESVAQDFDVNRHIRFNTPVRALVYEKPHWRLTTHSGEEFEFDIVISATGVLHHPAYPAIDGLESFAGTCFHSARWNHDIDLAGKRVGVIGTGSTACQIVGAIAEETEELLVFQRTPHWMIPMPQIEYRKTWNRLMALLPPLRRMAYHFYKRIILHTFSEATIGNARMQKLITRACLKHLQDAVPDAQLREKLTPDYAATCKRLIVCSDYYPAVSRPDTHLITDNIRSIEREGVRTVDGALHKLDVLVLATGFDASAFILPTTVTGENGADLEQRWQGSPRAHRAVAIPDFPNFWMLEGPTGPVGNFSLITITEHQVDYIISMLDKMKSDHLAAIAPKQASFEAYNQAMGEAVKHTTWYTGGCDSWYIDDSGIPNLYPWSPLRYLKDMRNPDFSEYRLIHQ